MNKRHSSKSMYKDINHLGRRLFSLFLMYIVLIVNNVNFDDKNKNQKLVDAWQMLCCEIYIL